MQIFNYEEVSASNPCIVQEVICMDNRLLLCVLELHKKNLYLLMYFDMFSQIIEIHT